MAGAARRHLGQPLWVWAGAVQVHDARMHRDGGRDRAPGGTVQHRRGGPTGRRRLRCGARRPHAAGGYAGAARGGALRTGGRRGRRGGRRRDRRAPRALRRARSHRDDHDELRHRARAPQLFRVGKAARARDAPHSGNPRRSRSTSLRGVRRVSWVGGELDDPRRAAGSGTRVGVSLSHARRLRAARGRTPARRGRIRRHPRQARVVQRAHRERRARRPGRNQLRARLQALLRRRLYRRRGVPGNRRRAHRAQQPRRSRACGAVLCDAVTGRTRDQRHGAQADRRGVAGDRDPRGRGGSARGAAPAARAALAAEGSGASALLFLAQTVRIAIPYLFKRAAGGAIAENGWRG